MDEQNATSTPETSSGQTIPIDIGNDKLLAGSAYIIFFIPFLVGIKTDFVKFHTNQATVLFLFGFAGWIFFVVLSAVIPFLFFMTFLIAPVYNLFLLVLVVMGIINVSKGEMKKLPLIGEIVLIK